MQEFQGDVPQNGREVEERENALFSHWPVGDVQSTVRSSREGWHAMLLEFSLFDVIIGIHGSLLGLS